MTVVLLSDQTSTAHLADRELATALSVLGLDVVVEACPGLALSDAAAYGHRLSALWAAEPPGAVLAHGWLAGLAAQVVQRAIGVPVIQRFGRLTAPGEDPGRARLEAAIARGARVVLASCPEQAEQIAATGIPRGGVQVVPQGVDITSFTDAGEAWTRDGRLRLVATDDLSRPDAIGALIPILAAMPATELLVIGPGSSADPEYHPVAGSLASEARRLGVADRLRFLGHVDDTDLPGLLRSADVVVASGHDDTDLALVLRAMACGVAVVASDVGAISDAVADGVTGMLVPPRPPGRLGAAVRNLLTDDLVREGCGFAATDRARARFSWTTVAESTAWVIDEVLRQAPQVPQAPAGTARAQHQGEPVS